MLHTACQGLLHHHASLTKLGMVQGVCMEVHEAPGSGVDACIAPQEPPMLHQTNHEDSSVAQGHHASLMPTIPGPSQGTPLGQAPTSTEGMSRLEACQAMPARAWPLSSSLYGVGTP